MKKDKGPSKHQAIQKMHPETKMERIIKLIREGVSYTEILDSFPTMGKSILSHMHLRPGRRHKTMCCYIAGGTGIGKTTLVNEFLVRLRDAYPHITTYYKAHGFNKEYWDGYFNQPIVIIDDPSLPTNTQNMATISETYKNILSTGEFICNVKYGAMQFDSHLVIILSNIPARQMSDHFAPEDREAHYRRFADSFGEYVIGTSDELKHFLVTTFIANLHELLLDRNLITDDLYLFLDNVLE